MNMRELEIISEGVRRAIFKGDGSQKTAFLYMDELARAIAEHCEDTDAFIEGSREALHRIFENGVPVSAKTELLTVFCRRAVLHLAKFGRSIGLSDFFEGEASLGTRIAYVKNAVSDDAYRVFSRVIKDASVTYSGSFAQACEDVYYGRVAYCILPYETSDEGVLSGFMKLIRKYELYPHYVCVCGGEKNATRLALLGRSPCASDFDGSKNARLKLTFYRPEPDTLSRISVAGRELSLLLTKSDSFPVSFEDGLYGLDLTFNGCVDDILPFLLYLVLDAPECSDKAIFYDAI
jgi:hypothetical protein